VYHVGPEMDSEGEKTSPAGKKMGGKGLFHVLEGRRVDFNTKRKGT